MKQANHNLSGFGVVSCIDFNKGKKKQPKQNQNRITCTVQNCELILTYHLNKGSDYTKIGKLGIFCLSRSDMSIKFIYIESQNGLGEKGP